jgi:hypothetical protein
MDQNVTKTVSHVVPVMVALWIEREAARRGISKSKLVTEILEAAKDADASNDAEHNAA